MSKPKDDLISRAAALNAIDCWHIDFNSMDGAKVQTDCWRTIKELPAVDAAPVVLCRDCIHWQEPFDSNNTGYLVAHCDMFKDGDAFHEQFYCAHGERRDSNGKNT